MYFFTKIVIPAFHLCYRSTACILNQQTQPGYNKDWMLSP